MFLLNPSMFQHHKFLSSRFSQMQMEDIRGKFEVNNSMILFIIISWEQCYYKLENLFGILLGFNIFNQECATINSSEAFEGWFNTCY
jgi:hypothetical protein